MARLSPLLHEHVNMLGCYDCAIMGQLARDDRAVFPNSTGHLSGPEMVPAPDLVPLANGYVGHGATGWRLRLRC